MGHGGLEGPLWSTIVGALIGAVVAGAISLCIQRYSIQLAKAERETARKSRELTFAKILLIRLIRVSSQLKSFGQSLDESEIGSHSVANASEPWQVTPPFVAIPEFEQMSEQEAIYLASMRDNDLFVRALELVDIFNNFLSLLKFYSTKREELTKLPPADSFSGNFVFTALERAQQQEIGARSIALNQLVIDLRHRSKQDLTQAKAVLTKYAGLNRAKFGADFPNFQFNVD